MQNCKLPLHYAARDNAGREVVAALLLAYLDAASTPDGVRCGLIYSGGVCASYVCSCVHVAHTNMLHNVHVSHASMYVAVSSIVAAYVFTCTHRVCLLCVCVHFCMHM